MSSVTHGSHTGTVSDTSRTISRYTVHPDVGLTSTAFQHHMKIRHTFLTISRENPCGILWCDKCDKIYIYRPELFCATFLSIHFFDELIVVSDMTSTMEGLSSNTTIFAPHLSSCGCTHISVLLPVVCAIHCA